MQLPGDHQTNKEIHLREDVVKMPYIPQSFRPHFDEEINALIKKFHVCLTDNQVDGTLNYVITRLFKGLYRRRYKYMNRAIGVLECAKLEYYRRVMAPYEDEKIEENGDVK